MKKGFSIQEVLHFGWQAYLKNALFLLITTLVVLVIPSLFVILSPEPFFNTQAIPLRALFLPLVTFIVNIFLCIAIINISLKVAKEQKPTAADFFTALPRFFSYLGAYIIFGLIILAGLILLIFPALIFAMHYFLYGYLVVDKGEGPFQSLKDSSRLIYGYKWKLFRFTLVALLLNILGAACLGIGLLITLPVTWVASARIYVQLRHDRS